MKKLYKMIYIVLVIALMFFQLPTQLHAQNSLDVGKIQLNNTNTIIIKATKKIINLKNNEDEIAVNDPVKELDGKLIYVVEADTITAVVYEDNREETVQPVMIQDTITKSVTVSNTLEHTVQITSPFTTEKTTTFNQNGVHNITLNLVNDVEISIDYTVTNIVNNLEIENETTNETFSFTNIPNDKLIFRIDKKFTLKKVEFFIDNVKVDNEQLTVAEIDDKYVSELPSEEIYKKLKDISKNASIKVVFTEEGTDRKFEKQIIQKVNYQVNIAFSINDTQTTKLFKENVSIQVASDSQISSLEIDGKTYPITNQEFDYTITPLFEEKTLPNVTVNFANGQSILLETPKISNANNEDVKLMKYAIENLPVKQNDQAIQENYTFYLKKAYTAKESEPKLVVQANNYYTMPKIVQNTAEVTLENAPIYENGTWIYSLPKVSGNYQATLNLFDLVWKFNFKIVYDETKPTIELTEAGNLVDNLNSDNKHRKMLKGEHLKVSITDENLNEESIKYYLNSTPIEASSVSNNEHIFNKTMFIEGENTLKVTAKDLSGNETTKIFIFTYDNEPANSSFEINNQSSPANEIYVNQLNPVLVVKESVPSFEDTNLKDIHVSTLNDLNYFNEIQPFSPGKTRFNFTIKADENEDKNYRVLVSDFGYGAPKVHLFKLIYDIENPTLTFENENEFTLKDGVYYTNSTNPKFTFADNKKMKSVKVNDEIVVKEKTLALIDDELQTYTFTLEDMAGNKLENVTYKFIKDTKSVNANLTLQNKNVVHQDLPYINTAIFKYQLNENEVEEFKNSHLKSVTFELFDMENRLVESTKHLYNQHTFFEFTSKNVKDGKYKVVATLEDYAKNLSVYETEVVVDTVEPTIQNVVTKNISATGREDYIKEGDNIKITFESNEKIFPTAVVNGIPREVVEVSPNKFEINYTTQKTNYKKITFNISFKDMADNSSKYETIAPFIHDFVLNNIEVTTYNKAETTNKVLNTNNEILFTVKSDEKLETNPQTDVIKVSFTNNQEIFATYDAKVNTPFTVKIPNLQDGTIGYIINYQDYAGNKNTKTDVVYTYDKTSPSSSLVIQNARENDVYNHNVQITNNVTDNSAKTSIVNVVKDGVSILQESYSNDSWTRIFEQEGKYQVIVTTTDAGHNRTKIEKTFEIDKTNPEIVGSYNGGEIVNNKYYNVAVVPVFRVKNPEDRIVSVLLNNQDITNNITASSVETTYHFIVTAKDKAENLSQYQVSYTVDTTAPKVVISGVQNGVYYADYVTPRLDYSDTNLLENGVVHTLNGNTFSFNTVVQNGYHTLLVEVKDKAENVTKHVVSFGVSKDGLKIEVPAQLKKQYVTEDITINLSEIINSSIDYDIVSATVNGQSIQDKIEINKDGKYVIYVEAKDKAGNIIKENIEFILDKTLPQVVFEPFNGREVIISLVNVNDEIEEILLNNEKVEFTKNDKNQYIVKINKVGMNEIIVKAKDKADNKSERKLTIDKKDYTVYIIGGIVSIITIIICFFFILFKRKKDKEETNE